MTRSRTLILIGILLLLVAVVVLVLVPQVAPAPAPNVQPTPVEIPTTQIMVAAQNIPRGKVIGPDAIIPFKWPNASLPPKDLIVTDPSQIIGKIARTDILRLQPFMLDLVTANPGDLVKLGCDLALSIPNGEVAVAFPINQISSAGYSAGAGDRVDVIATFSVVDINQNDQYPSIPFNRDYQSDLIAAGFTPLEAANLAITKNDAAIAQALQQPGVYLPRLETQMILQNIEILHVGDWPAQCQLAQPEPALAPDQNPSAAPAPVGGTPTATPLRPTIYIFAVEREQALVLDWLRNSHVSVTFATRSAGDNTPATTDTVHYQYLLTTYAIAKPPKTDTIIQSLPAGNP